MRSLFFLLAGFVASSLACTTVMLKTAKDGCTVVGRTMELGIPLEKSELEQIYIHPRGTTVGTAHGTYNASKYGYLAVQFAVGSTTLRMATTEGINEAGLTVSAQVHMQASYEPSHNITRAVTLFDIQATAFLLGCCKTVAQAADALASVAVISTPLIGALGQLHWSVQVRILHRRVTPTRAHTPSSRSLTRTLEFSVSSSRPLTHARRSHLPTAFRRTPRALRESSSTLTRRCASSTTQKLACSPTTPHTSGSSAT